jgi:hypothetical protein
MPFGCKSVLGPEKFALGWLLTHGKRAFVPFLSTVFPYRSEHYLLERCNNVKYDSVFYLDPVSDKKSVTVVNNSELDLFTRCPGINWIYHQTRESLVYLLLCL